MNTENKNKNTYMTDFSQSLLLEQEIEQMVKRENDAKRQYCKAKYFQDQQLENCQPSVDLIQNLREKSLLAAIDRDLRQCPLDEEINQKLKNKKKDDQKFQQRIQQVSNFSNSNILFQNQFAKQKIPQSQQKATDSTAQDSYHIMNKAKKQKKIKKPARNQNKKQSKIQGDNAAQVKTFQTLEIIVENPTGLRSTDIGKKIYQKYYNDEPESEIGIIIRRVSESTNFFTGFGFIRKQSGKFYPTRKGVQEYLKCPSYKLSRQEKIRFKKMQMSLSQDQEQKQYFEEEMK